MHNSFFRNKTIFITGGTGSIGSEILRYLIPLKPKRIKVFSRDEYKQYRLKFHFNTNTDTQLEYILGDVRDGEALAYASQNTDILFHAAAFKHVPQSEEMPEEFIKTNILGSLNIKKAALKNSISTIVSISSDKAVFPSNVMGLTKAIQEKIFSSYYLQKEKTGTKFVNVRFGNVIGTKGSLFPIFYHQIKNKQPITITETEMTRFFMSKKEAVNLIFWSAVHGNDGEIVIRNMKSIKIGALLKTFLTLLKKPENYPVNRIGIRVGEKMHESLITEDELFKVTDREGYYVIKPYSEKEIQKNIIIGSLKETKHEMSEFRSEAPENFLSEKEVLKYVKDYIQETNQSREFI